MSVCSGDNSSSHHRVHDSLDMSACMERTALVQKYGSPGSGLKKIVNKSIESAPSRQDRAVAVWGLGSRLALGASRRASALSSRGISVQASPASPAPLPVLAHLPVLPSIPVLSLQTPSPALPNHLWPPSPFVRRPPGCVGRKPRGLVLAEH